MNDSKCPGCGCEPLENGSREFRPVVDHSATYAKETRYCMHPWHSEPVVVIKIQAVVTGGALLKEQAHERDDRDHNPR